VHFIEGDFITPIMQSEATSLPPVMSLLSVIACELLLGPSAVFLAVPLALSVVTAIEVLYVEPRIALDRKVELDHRANSRRWIFGNPVGAIEQCQRQLPKTRLRLVSQDEPGDAHAI
jgi:hypothetical protein